MKLVPPPQRFSWVLEGLENISPKPTFGFPGWHTLQMRAMPLLNLITVSYLLTIGGWLLLRWRFGDSFWWLMTLNVLGAYLFVPALPLTGWYLLHRKRGWLLSASLPLLIYLLWFWPYWLPQSAPAQMPNPLRVLSFNVLYSNQNYDQLADLITAQQPDLIALQEVKLETMRQLVKRLEADYPYYVLGDYNPYGSTAAFSHYPIQKGYVLNLEADRPAVVMQLRIKDHSVTFISAHLRAFGWAQLLFHLQAENLPATFAAIAQFRTEQQRQTEILADEAAKLSSDTTILACDCNTREFMSSYALLTTHFQQAAHDFGWRPQLSTPANSFRDLSPQHLDYIFYSGRITPQLVYKLKQRAGSDHHPLIADFALRNS